MVDFDAALLLLTCFCDLQRREDRIFQFQCSTVNTLTKNSCHATLEYDVKKHFVVSMRQPEPERP